MKLLKIDNLTGNEEYIDSHNAFNEISRNNYDMLQKDYDIHSFDDFVYYFEVAKGRRIGIKTFDYVSIR